MQTALVVGRDDPRRDGVADYVHRLAAHLPAHGVDAVVVEAGGRVGAAAASWAGCARTSCTCRSRPPAYGFSPAVGLLPVARARRRVVTTLHEYGWWSWPGRVPDAAVAPARAGRAVGPRDRPAHRGVAGRCSPRRPGHAQAVRARMGVTARVVPIGPNVERVPADRAAVRRGLRPARAGAGGRLLRLRPPGQGRALAAAGGAAAAGRRCTPTCGWSSPAASSRWPCPGRRPSTSRPRSGRDVRALGLDDAVTITGWVPAEEVSALLQAADVAALPFTAGPDHQERLPAGRPRPRPAAGRHPRPGHRARARGGGAARPGPRERGARRAPRPRAARAGASPAAGRSPTRTPGTAAAQAHAEVYGAVLR